MSLPAPVRYEPSALEREWSTGGLHRRICETAKLPHQISGASTWVEYIQQASRGGPWTPRRPPSAAERRVLSRIVDRDGCEAFIEPLTGIARHPFASIGCKMRNVNRTDKFDISYLLPQNRCARGGGACGTRPGAARGRNLFFDLGCSSYGRSSATPSTLASKPRLLASSWRLNSIPLFAGLYERNCISFDRIWAWEAKQYDQQAWWEAVPVEMRAKLTFFNLPVDEDSHSSALGLLKAAARPEDFVVLKVDIDTPLLELRIVNAIAEQPELAELIDELYFEYHFKFDKGVYFGWGRHSGTNHTVDDAIGLMGKLRRQGVRAHFWV